MPILIAPLLARVSQARIERDVRHLATAYPTRHTLGRYLFPCSEWLAAQFRAANRSLDVSFHEYTAANRKLRNVVAIQRGRSSRTVIVCAHFDSRMQDINDSVSPAPGADDNATGVAVVLELARLLAPIPLTDTIRFVLFSGEEQDLWGSSAYAQKVRADRTDIHFVFNLDEVGYPPRERVLFVDEDKKHPERGSHALVTRAQQLARDVVRVPVRVDPAVDSDYVPFADAGYVVAGLYEAGKYPSYHTSSDTPEKVDYAYVTDMARLALAFLVTECQ